METNLVDVIVAKDVLNESTHNCGECQPYIKGEKLLAGCLTGCRPDSEKRGGDAWHMKGCANAKIKEGIMEHD